MTQVVNKCIHRPTSNDVYIGRPSRWGNPFKIGRDGTRAEVIAKYETWIKSQPDLMKDVPNLRGRTLVCWCAPAACHGDVLKRMCEEPCP